MFTKQDHPGKTQADEAKNAHSPERVKPHPGHDAATAARQGRDAAVGSRDTTVADEPDSTRDYVDEDDVTRPYGS